MDAETNTKQNFYGRFRESHAALEGKIEQLPSLGPTERPEAVDRCLAAISTLSDVVKDASSYLPAYDQRSYSEQIRALSEKLADTRKSITPKQKFSFKSKGKDTTSRIGGAMKSSPSTPQAAPVISTQSSSDRPKADNLVISSISGKHIKYETPHLTSTSASSLLLSDITDSLVVFITTTSPFPSATVKNVSGTVLFLAGAIEGPIHLTSLTNITIVVTCRQFRMHDAKDVDVYLLCSSRPIIEDCSGVRFAPLDAGLVGGEWGSVRNLWNQVDDFKWLKSEHSPNWAIMEEDEKIPRGMWEEVREKWVGEDGEEVRGIIGRYLKAC